MLLRLNWLRYAAVLLCLLSSLPAFAWQPGRAVRVALHDAEPLAFRDEEGRPQGFLIDVLQLIARQEGWRLRYVDGSWDEGMRRVVSGELDLIFPILQTPSRDERLDFNKEPAFASWGVVFARRGLTLHALSGVNGLKIGMIRGDYFGQRFLQVLRDFKVEAASVARFDTSEELFAAARDGRIDAFPFESTGGRLAQTEHGMRPTTIVFESVHPFFATARGTNADLLLAIDQRLRSLKADPDSAYFTMYNDWFAPTRTPRWIGPAAAVAVLLIVLFVLFSALLRGQVAKRTRELQQRNAELEEQIVARQAAEADRAEMAEQLQRAARLEAMGVVSAGLAHDFNNLLMVISAQLDALPQNGADASRAAIADAVQQASGLTRSLLTFGGRNPTEKLPLNLASLVVALQRLLGRMLPDGVTLSVDTSEAGEAWVLGDEVSFQQVLMNLAKNAGDAMPTGGSLEITVKGPKPGTEADPTVVVDVADTGIGMDPEESDRAFEPFYTTKPRRKGTGLGLAIVHGIVTQHGGTIQILSQSGQGTCVRLELPGIAAPVTPSAPTAAGPATVVVADAQRATREMVASFLTEQGYQVRQCSTADELAQALPDGDLLILDNDLPGSPGEPTVLRMRSAGHHTPVILVSGSLNLSAETQEDERLGVLIKPFRLPALGRLAHTLLEEKPA